MTNPCWQPEEKQNPGPHVAIGTRPRPSIHKSIEDIASQVAELQDDSHDLAEIRATLILNFVQKERAMKNFGFTIEEDKPIRMMMKIFERLLLSWRDARKPNGPQSLTR